MVPEVDVADWVRAAMLSCRHADAAAGEDAHSPWRALWTLALGAASDSPLLLPLLRVLVLGLGDRPPAPLSTEGNTPARWLQRWRDQARAAAKTTVVAVDRGVPPEALTQAVQRWVVDATNVEERTAATALCCALWRTGTAHVRETLLRAAWSALLAPTTAGVPGVLAAGAIIVYAHAFAPSDPATLAVAPLAQAADVLRARQADLVRHPNLPIYERLAPLVNLKGSVTLLLSFMLGGQWLMRWRAAQVPAGGGAMWLLPAGRAPVQVHGP